MAGLSPAAKAVLDAFKNPERVALAAALRAAADSIDFDPWLQEHADYCTKLCAIAAELDPLPLPSGEGES